MYEYSAVCTRVVDGDTMDLDIDLGCHVHVHERVRLAGINTPETYGVKKDSDEYKAGMAAKERVEDLVVDTMLVVKTDRDKQGKYGRYIATILIPGDGDELTSLNDLLVEEGLAQRVSY